MDLLLSKEFHRPLIRILIAQDKPPTPFFDLNLNRFQGRIEGIPDPGDEEEIGTSGDEIGGQESEGNRRDEYE